MPTSRPHARRISAMANIGSASLILRVDSNQLVQGLNAARSTITNWAAGQREALHGLTSEVENIGKNVASTVQGAKLSGISASPVASLISGIWQGVGHQIAETFPLLAQI